MSIKPILFNTEMVRASLDGRKTCTRRLVRFLPGENPQWTGYIRDGLMLYNGRNEPCITKAPYQPGDILYVRETWQYLYELDGNEQVVEDTGKYYYAATDTILFDTYVDENGVKHNHVPWKPSIHMPKEAARIWLKVTDVRVKRLQEITNDEAVKEGIYVSNCKDCNAPFGCDSCPDEGYDEIDEFAELWDSTIKKSDLDRYGWDSSPWVWVIEFERCEKPEGV